MIGRIAAWIMLFANPWVVQTQSAAGRQIGLLHVAEPTSLVTLSSSGLHCLTEVSDNRDGIWLKVAEYQNELGCWQTWYTIPKTNFRSVRWEPSDERDQSVTVMEFGGAYQ